MNPKLELLIPMEEIEHEAQQQIYEVLKHDVVKKLAIMPDVHTGYSLPIGAVALLDDHISPAYVGYDISCGMAFMNTGIKMDINNQRKELFDACYRHIPCGEGKSNKTSIAYPVFSTLSNSKELIKEVNRRVPYQLGTLGGGNHFIEFGYNKDHELCITIHSGSRNIGHRICTWYCKNAPEFIPIHSELGHAYFEDMLYCVEWAKANRLEMMRRLIQDVLGLNIPMSSIKTRTLTVTHNFAEITPDGVLHRKGATPARAGEIGVIPGNMRDGVWIVKGLGNERFLNSSSHGCGRVMSRTKAKENIKLEDFDASMVGIMANISQHTLDESPMAYKNSDMVINAQENIVFNVIDHIKPIINVKG